jgi:hypothetical protein
MYKLYSKLQRQQAIQAVSQAPDDFVVIVRQRTRSLEQNAMLWRLLTELANKVPWQVNGEYVMLSTDDWKDIVTASLTEENRIAKGIRGGFVILGKSTSVMTVSQMSQLIEFIYAFAAEQGVVLDV